MLSKPGVVSSSVNGPGKARGPVPGAQCPGPYPPGPIMGASTWASVPNRSPATQLVGAHLGRAPSKVRLVHSFVLPVLWWMSMKAASRKAGFSIQEGRFQHPGRPVSASGRGLNSHPGLGRFSESGRGTTQHPGLRTTPLKEW